MPGKLDFCFAIFKCIYKASMYKERQTIEAFLKLKSETNKQTNKAKQTPDSVSTRLQSRGGQFLTNFETFQNAVKSTVSSIRYIISIELKVRTIFHGLRATKEVKIVFLTHLWGLQ